MENLEQIKEFLFLLNKTNDKLFQTIIEINNKNEILTQLITILIERNLNSNQTKALLNNLIEEIKVNEINTNTINNKITTLKRELNSLEQYLTL